MTTSKLRSGSVLIDVAPQHPLKCLGLEAAFDNETALPIKRATCPQLCQQELLHMLGLPIHCLAELHEIGEDCLFGSFPGNLTTNKS